MARIFISYRRDDSGGWAGRLYDRLSQQFGRENVFMDINTIEAGLDFVEVIEQAVGSCDVLIALIGKQWLTITDDAGLRRLDYPEDFVRLEIAAALARNIRVIPALVQGASMPRSTDLPDVLKLLARRNAIDISETRFHSDVDRLIAVLDNILKGAEPTVAKGDDHLRPLREGGMTKRDIALFKAAYEKMLETDKDICYFEAVLHEGNNLGLNAEEVIAATQIGSDLGLWKATQLMGPSRYSYVEASTPGMEQYCQAFMPDYPSLTADVQKQILEGIMSSGQISRSELASTVGKPEIVIGHILRQLQESDHIRIDDEATFVFEVKPKLKRLFEQS
jgi:hypothetical protein